VWLLLMSCNVLFGGYVVGIVKSEKKKYAVQFLLVDCSVLLYVYAVGT
jgi:hypothetical protein